MEHYPSNMLAMMVTHITAYGEASILPMPTPHACAPHVCRCPRWMHAMQDMIMADIRD